jgi:hypothetical protein
MPRVEQQESTCRLKVLAGYQAPRAANVNVLKAALAATSANPVAKEPDAESTQQRRPDPEASKRCIARPLDGGVELRFWAKLCPIAATIVANS